LVGSFTAQAAVTLPDVSEAMESGPAMPAVSMSLGLPHAPPTGRVAALTVVLVSQTTVALPDPVAGNNAFASAVWPVGIQVKYHLALKQSDYR
jgi:hypothetical protein